MRLFGAFIRARGGFGAFALGALALGCGATSTSPTAGAAGTPSSSAIGGDSASGGARAEDGGAGAAGSAAAVALDSSNCAERPRSDCEGVATLYSSNDKFDRTPAFAECSAFNSYDGCGLLEFSFDAQGCAVSVSPGPAGWTGSEHLQPLQACLVEALGGASYPCLASKQLRYEESCFIR